MSDKVLQYYDRYYDRSRELEALASYVANHYTHNMPIIICTLSCMLFVCTYVLHDIITESKAEESEEKELPLPVAKPKRRSLFREFRFDSYKEYVNDEVDPLTTLEELEDMNRKRSEAAAAAAAAASASVPCASLASAAHHFDHLGATQFVFEPSSAPQESWPEPKLTLLEALA